MPEPESEPVVRPGDRLVDLDQLIADALSAGAGRDPSQTMVDRVVEVVSVLLEGRDAEIERLRRPIAGKLDEVLLRLSDMALQVRPRCSCDGDPIECSHEAARGVVEAELAAKDEELQRAKGERLVSAIFGTREPTCPKAFALYRHEDVTGASGTGLVATGVRFDDGTTVLRWRGDTPSTVVWPSLQAAEKVHGHDGRTHDIAGAKWSDVSEAAGEPPVPRVWRKGDPEPAAEPYKVPFPRVVDHYGIEWVADERHDGFTGWRTDSHGLTRWSSWRLLALERGPLTELLPEGGGTDAN